MFLENEIFSKMFIQNNLKKYAENLKKKVKFSKIFHQNKIFKNFKKNFLFRENNNFL